MVVAVLGFAGGAAAGAATVPPGSGLAGGATVFVWGAGGLLLGAVIAAFLIARLTEAQFRVASLAAAALAALALLWLAARVMTLRSAGGWVPVVLEQRLAAAPAQRYPTLRRSDLPIGLGIARVAPVPGRDLHFYPTPRVGDLPDGTQPVASVRFGPGQPSVTVTEAPPWFEPEHLKIDYELLDLRVLTLGREWVEVIGNSRTGETWWVNRADVTFASWPEHLLGVSSVEVLDPETNAIRVRPLDDSPIMATTTDPLPPLAVSGDWLKVATHALADRMPPEGWIRWRRGDRLLVSYSPLS